MYVHEENSWRKYFTLIYVCLIYAICIVYDICHAPFESQFEWRKTVTRSAGLMKERKRDGEKETTPTHVPEVPRFYRGFGSISVGICMYLHINPKLSIIGYLFLAHQSRGLDGGSHNSIEPTPPLPPPPLVSDSDRVPPQTGDQQTAERG